MRNKFLPIFVIGLLLTAGLSGCKKEAKSQAVIDGIFAQEMTLKELAKNRTSPSRQLIRVYAGGRNASISTPTTKAAIWGGGHEITMSLLKTDVFDRRYIDREHFTMDDLIRGAYSEANKNVNPFRDFNTLVASNGGGNRPSYFILDERGGGYNPSIWSQIYPFPCQKPVGQVIVKAEEFEDAPLPESVQYIKNGVTCVSVNKGDKKLNVNYVMGMKRNVTAIDLSYEGLSKPISFRIFRHQDQGHIRYMNADGSYKKIVQYQPADKSKPVEYYDFNADKEINGRFEPPTNGVDGRFFWVHQVFPKEKTFPQGFRYVMMGMVSGVNAEVTAMGLAKNLGTRPSPISLYDPALGNYYTSDISTVPGVAVNAKLPAKSGNAKLYIAVVTVNDTPNYMEEAKKMLLEAEKLGFEGIAAENEAWYDAHYEKREQGRILMGATPEERKQTADIFFDEVFTSWTTGHMGSNNPDPRNLEATASYALYDTDIQNWHSMPCYNELFTEGKFFMRNQYEPKIQWPNLLTQWHETLKEKARLKFGLPGMYITHGYLPPLSKEGQSPWYCENYVLDYTMEVPGQVMKVVWNFWDYAADEVMLKNTIYPLLKDLAIFYEAFARRGWDGKVFNLEPTVETEAYGISYQMRYTRNNTGALTMFRWTLNTAIEAAQYLNVDADLIPGWREVAENLAPYPKFMMSGGEILGNNEVFFPSHSPGDHGMKNAYNVANLSDEINLDSPQELKDMMIRTADVIMSSGGPYVLVGASADYIPPRYANGATKIETYAQLASQVVATPERLMNSRSGRIHLFPVVPEWTVATFRGFLARGGFEVSATRDESGVQAVVVKARRSVPLQLMNPWKGKHPAVTDITTGKTVGYKMDKSNGECIVFNAEAGHAYSFDK